MSDSGIILSATPDHAFGVFGPLVISQWRITTSIEGARKQHELIEKILRERPCIGVLVVLETDVSKPDDETRGVIAKTMQISPDKLLGLAYVVPDTGFGGAIKRGVITGLDLLSGRGSTSKTFDAVPPSVEWLRSRLATRGASLDARAASEFAERVRTATGT